MTEELTNLVDEGYRLFGRYRFKGLLQVCLCPVCMTEEQQRDISSTPLRQISCQLMSEYTNSAHGVPGNADELKYLLPRYLELMAAGDYPSDIGWEVVMNRFGDARHPEQNLLEKMTSKLRGNSKRQTATGVFTTEEKGFIDRFLFALLIQSASDCPETVEEMLVMMAGAGSDLTGAVVKILAEPSGYGADAIAWMAVDGAAGLIQYRKLANVFWDSNKRTLQQMQIVISEMISAEAIKELETAALNVADEKRAQLISEGHNILETAAASLGKA